MAVLEAFRGRNRGAATVLKQGLKTGKVPGKRFKQVNTKWVGF
jgi:hypothetical protein